MRPLNRTKFAEIYDTCCASESQARNKSDVTSGEWRAKSPRELGSGFLHIAVMRCVKGPTQEQVYRSLFPLTPEELRVLLGRKMDADMSRNE